MHRQTFCLKKVVFTLTVFIFKSLHWIEKISKLKRWRQGGHKIWGPLAQLMILCPACQAWKFEAQSCWRRLICADSCHFPPYCNSGGHLDHHLLWSLIRLLVGRDQNIRDSQHARCIFSTSSQIRVKSEDEGANYLEKGCVQYRGYN